ncbi:hypothetical protein AWB79_06299 [Caballeronia hypogeia]|uniref:Uncharacterized protein n=1 Tax=Caballeronia hypogeia TaxID=1777140 RepID=A0A158D1U5_9BURK|nr:hypothetical protein [Caballeronia hypogeia]SAK88441.1 hypothetical protein AWB79_06299 [Caballeronia hypogeia]
MTRARILLIGSAIATFAASGAYAQTTAQPQPMQPQTMQPMQAAPGAAAPGQMPVQAQQPVTPAQQNLVAPAPTDPLVQRRNANAQANAEYKASKKASKAELAAQSKQAKAQYKEEVKNAKVNRKADKDAAKAELNATEPNAPKDAGLQH